jgi:hypothetical protein
VSPKDEVPASRKRDGQNTDDDGYEPNRDRPAIWIEISGEPLEITEKRHAFS